METTANPIILDEYGDPIECIGDPEGGMMDTATMDGMEQYVCAVIEDTRCPNCGSKNYGYNSTDGAACRSCDHHWWPPPPYAQPKTGARVAES